MSPDCRSAVVIRVCRHRGRTRRRASRLPTVTSAPCHRPPGAYRPSRVSWTSENAIMT